MNTQYPSYKLRWLSDAVTVDHTIHANDADFERMPLPIPPSLGRGWLEMQHLMSGMMLFRGVHQFEVAAKDQLIPLVEFESHYLETNFCVQTVHGGQLHHHDRNQKIALISGPGRDLFRHTNHVQTQTFLDGSSDSEMISIAVSDNMLTVMLGEDNANALISGLGLAKVPTSLVHSIPIPVTAILRAAMTEKLHGPARKLFAQARVLEYLGELLNFVAQETTPLLQHKRERIRELHEQLEKLEGKMPTLETLAKDYGMSARLLNKEFSKEYGQTIYAYITDRRLDETHAVLQQSTLPLKQLANILGYSHVNHFSAAFKKKFGYSPSSLRR